MITVAVVGVEADRVGEAGEDAVLPGDAHGATTSQEQPESAHSSNSMACTTSIIQS